MREEYSADELGQITKKASLPTQLDWYLTSLKFLILEGGQESLVTYREPMYAMHDTVRNSKQHVSEDKTHAGESAFDPKSADGGSAEKSIKNDQDEMIATGMQDNATDRYLVSATVWSY